MISWPGDVIHYKPLLCITKRQGLMGNMRKDANRDEDRKVI